MSGIHKNTDFGCMPECSVLESERSLRNEIIEKDFKIPTQKIVHLNCSRVDGREIGCDVTFFTAKNFQLLPYKTLVSNHCSEDKKWSPKNQAQG